MQFATYSEIEIIGIKGMQKLVHLEISEIINEHAKAILNIYIEPAYDRERFCMDNAGKDICIKVKGSVVFCGYICQLKDINSNGLHVYRVEVSSYSQKLDLSVKSRSFQNVSNNYEEIVEKVLKDYSNANVVWENSGHTKIDIPIFQYAETDWEFIKRLASIWGCEVISNVYISSPYILIDIPNDKMIEFSEYKYIECGLFENSLCKYHKVICDKDYVIGSTISIEEGIGRIVEKSIRMVESELHFEYCITEEHVGQRAICNSKLVGVQLPGTVIDVKTDMLKVQLDIDETCGGAAEYFFDWKPSSSNIMYAMPEKKTKVHLRIGDIRGQQLAVINCLPVKNVSDNIQDNSNKVMEYSDKRLEFSMNKLEFTNKFNGEMLVDLELIDWEGIYASVMKKFAMAMKKGLVINSKTGKVTITSPFQIVVRDSSGDGETEVTVNDTIDIGGEVVDIKAMARIEYDPINDAPIEVKMNLKKLLTKILIAVAVVAVVAVVAAAAAFITVGTGGAALAAAVAVVTSAAVGGTFLAGIGCYFQGKEDKKNGIKRGFGEYLYQAVDNFCTGAILSAPLGMPFSLPVQLLGVGFCSFTYQGFDKLLDNKYGGDFYDEDSNMILTAIFDVAFAGLGSVISNGMNKWILKNITKMPKGGYINMAKFLNNFKNVEFPAFINKYGWGKFLIKYLGKTYNTSQGNINVLKTQLKPLLKDLQKFVNNKWVKYLFLGGDDTVKGFDITAPLTDSDINILFRWIVDGSQEKVQESEYDETYAEYSRLLEGEMGYDIIDFDEDGNLVFE